ncbi:MAG: hypothetical protein NVS9B12_00980 [Vulcanimicrobiaceae bacterium]
MLGAAGTGRGYDTEAIFLGNKNTGARFAANFCSKLGERPKGGRIGGPGEFEPAQGSKPRGILKRAG